MSRSRFQGGPSPFKVSFTRQWLPWGSISIQNLVVLLMHLNLWGFCYFHHRRKQTTGLPQSLNHADHAFRGTAFFNVDLELKRDLMGGFILTQVEWFTGLI